MLSSYLFEELQYYCSSLKFEQILIACLASQISYYVI